MPFEDPLSHAAIAELRRLRRRLADHGALTYRRRGRADEIAVAMEDFLALEAQGWKGRRKTALANNEATAAFARALAQRRRRAGNRARRARRGRCARHHPSGAMIGARSSRHA